MVNRARATMSPVLTPLADITSPFYLHPGQSPTLVLISTPLTEIKLLLLVESDAIGIAFKG